MPWPSACPQVTDLRMFLGYGDTWYGRMPKGLGKVPERDENLAPRLGPGPGPPTSLMRYGSLCCSIVFHPSLAPGPSSALLADQ